MRESTFTVVVCLIFSILNVAADCFANQDYIDVLVSAPEVTGPAFATAAYSANVPLRFEEASARSRFGRNFHRSPAPTKMPRQV